MHSGFSCISSEKRSTTDESGAVAAKTASTQDLASALQAPRPVAGPFLDEQLSDSMPVVKSAVGNGACRRQRAHLTSHEEAVHCLPPAASAQSWSMTACSPLSRSEDETASPRRARQFGRAGIWTRDGKIGQFSSSGRSLAGGQSQPAAASGRIRDSRRRETFILL
jgi:hypothetical protein